MTKNILCAYHAQTKEACEWVIANSDPHTDNLTVQNWVKACEEYLQSLALLNAT